MSFGYSIGDAILLSQLAWTVVQNSRRACGEHDELTREVLNLHVVLQRLEHEIAKPESPINRPGSTCKEELEVIISGCHKVLKILDQILEKYNTLCTTERSGRKLWQKIKFGNGEMMDLADLRCKMTFYTSALSLLLNMLSLGTIGKIEQQMNDAGGDLKEIKQAVNGITAHLIVQGHSEGSVLTAYPEDDKAIWKEFRRELIEDGFSSSVIREHKELIKAYVKELASRGLLDDDDPLESNPQRGFGDQHHEGASNLPTLPPSNTPTTPAASCPACSTAFAEATRDTNSDLRRHLRTSQRQNRIVGLRCPQLECRMRQPMRSDDLGPHLQHVHKMFSLSERQTVIEKSERSAMRVAAIDCYKAKDYAKLIRKCAIGEESPLNTFASQDYLPYTVSANIGCLFQALRLEPFSVTYLSMRAAAYMSVGLHQEALDDAYSAIHIVHFKPEAFHRLARTFVKLGDGKTAGFHDTLNKISSTQPTPAATASQFIEFSLELMERLSQEGADSNAENAPDQAEPGRRFSVDKTRELIIEARRKVFSRSSHSRKN